MAILCNSTLELQYQLAHTPHLSRRMGVRLRVRLRGVRLRVRRADRLRVRRGVRLRLR